MSRFSELIKNFDKTRDYVRDFFIYGFKMRNDFERKSSRTYDDEKRRVESWLGNYVRYDDSQRGRQMSITVDRPCAVRPERIGRGTPDVPTPTEGMASTARRRASSFSW